MEKNEQFVKYGSIIFTFYRLSLVTFHINLFIIYASNVHTGSFVYQSPIKRQTMLAIAQIIWSWGTLDSITRKTSSNVRQCKFSNHCIKFNSYPILMWGSVNSLITALSLTVITYLWLADIESIVNTFYEYSFQHITTAKPLIYIWVEIHVAGDSYRYLYNTWFIGQWTTPCIFITNLFVVVFCKFTEEPLSLGALAVP